MCDEDEDEDDDDEDDDDDDDDEDEVVSLAPSFLPVADRTTSLSADKEILKLIFYQLRDEWNE